MIQCKDCEFFKITPDGSKSFSCDPFSTIKESECITKWQLIRLDMLLASYNAMLSWQQQLAPLQDKIFKYMKREIEDIDESDKWKTDEEENPQFPDNPDDEGQQDKI